jgi:hypothetical protein
METIGFEFSNEINVEFVEMSLLTFVVVLKWKLIRIW